MTLERRGSSEKGEGWWSRGQRSLVFLSRVCSSDEGGQSQHEWVPGAQPRGLRALAKAPGGAVRRGLGCSGKRRCQPFRHLVGKEHVHDENGGPEAPPRMFLSVQVPHVTSVPQIAPEVELLICLSGWVGRDEPG